MTIKTIFIKIQEAFKSLGLASQLGITLGVSLAMLAGVYALSQDLSPLPKTKESSEVTSTESTTVQRDVVTSTSTVATTETTEVTTAAYRLIPLGNSNKDFETYQEAIQYMRDELDKSSKAFEEGKQDWVYSGRVYGVPWSDGRTTFTVDLVPKVMTPQTPDTSGISTELTQ